MNTQLTITDLSKLTGRKIPSQLDTYTKISLAIHNINTSKYDVLGLIGRSNVVLLEPKFYNIRAKNGRWAKVKQK